MKKNILKGKVVNLIEKDGTIARFIADEFKHEIGSDHSCSAREHAIDHASSNRRSSSFSSYFIQKQAEARPHKFWEMNTPELTPEVKRELEIISMRSYWDSASFFKDRNRKELPKEFEIGTVVAGAFDGKRGTLTRREKKQSLADELAADEAFKSRSDVVVEKEKAKRLRPKHKKRH
ncbi:uncharacterized protein [Blastocystis hominis]|uniref:Fcf2 pre-rRNA processing C-terminal domain-containing protein n=1 Tax=Blastocystis hominis TaxID=12968 RepID=D8LVD0_BLAHO|nr:uncharacterized protein [Blastocystis hominis]CBK19769.2 unnamed protein product [Blastocystis hominis]|eukprot:XP_012893817.1 uncharacterized protein [Blastocystis hominis]